MTGLRRSMWVVGTPVRAFLIGGIRLYQTTLSGWMGARCRFYPSCSHYAEEAIRIHGAARGSMLAAWRLLRCNPYGSWGFDHVPPSSRRPVAGLDPDATSHASSGLRPGTTSGMTPSHDLAPDGSSSVNA